VLEARLEPQIGLMHERGTDAAGTEIVHGELEQRLQQLAIGERLARADEVEPGRHQFLVVPREAVPAQDTKATDDANRTVRVALHDDGLQRLG
jgi:hypothetical protein